MSRAACLIVLFATGCFAPRVPTPSDLASADYGPMPPNEKLVEIVHHYLEVSAYFNPNAAFVQNCSTPTKTWVRDYAADRTGDFRYGWKVSCDVNPVSAYGGYQGFARHDYVIYGSDVIEHRLSR